MGTRHLTFVTDESDDIKIAQYGQWDGYFEGQGKTVLEFCSNSYNLNRLKEALPLCAWIDVFYTQEERDALDKRLAEYEPTALAWYNAYISRDIGARILENIVNNTNSFGNKDKKIHIIRNQFEFGNNGLMCEFAYGINFKDKVVEIYMGDWNGKLQELPQTRFNGSRMIKRYTFNEIQERKVDEIISELDALYKELRGDDEEADSTLPL